VRLNVYVLGPEELLRTVYGELLGNVNLLTTPVIPLARVALSVLVREHRTDRLQYRLRDEVLRGDHL
jgi:hypothetical protein